MHTPLAIANYFIQKSLETTQELTPMKLVKLSYIAHGWHLGLTGVPLFDEYIQAWKYGPVVNSIYHEFKEFGNSQVSSPRVEISNLSYGFKTPLPNDELKPFLDKIWQVYGGMNGLQLSTLTHQPNTPWDIVWNQQGGKNQKSAIIPNELIAEHYKNKRNVNPAIPAVN